MSAEDNVETLKALFDEWHRTKAQSIESWLTKFADNARFRSLAGGADPMAFTVECGSKEDIKRYFAGLVKDWEMVHYTVEEYIAQGDQVVARGTTEWRHTGTRKSVNTPKADFVTFRNGLISDFYEFYDTARVFAAATP